MATVYLTFGTAEHIRAGSKDVIMQGDNCRSESVTSSGSTAQGTLSAARDDTVCKVYCADQAVAVVSGSNPTATLATGNVVGAGVTEFIRVKAGQKVAVIDV